MTDRQEDRPLDVGIGLIGREEPLPRISVAEVTAAVLTLLWLGLVVLFFLVTDRVANPDLPGTLATVLMLVAIFLPVGMIWVAATTARSARALRAEARRLQGAVEAMRTAYVQQSQQSAMGRPSVERKLDEIAAAQRQTESAIATFASRRDHAQLPAPDRKAALPAPKMKVIDEQPALALGTPAEDLRMPVSVSDFILALNFPESPEDRDGFRALRRALEDRTMARLIRAAQDVLTLLAQDGIYMDDLRPDRARPEVWRRFAAGERGRGIAALGGVRDRSSLALTAGRMRQDTVFRDAAHHFLRQFDRTFQDFERSATDQDVADFAETRTARAFMLLGRVTGTFD
ncbi:hypothetical protein [Frigidibacter oleivorans]|uniref:hypothetical protein n=1 Tax=Frigidibacter oleivorans TaxID=2487129 RepID=UPI000F8DBE7E|nr:hypothetical protein [Frigidibacter oleivorans]